MSVFAGIDIGTSGTKAVLMEDCETVLAEASQSMPVSVPRPGWSEQHPDLWVESAFACLDRLAAEAPREMAAVQGIGLSGQMLTALLLDRDLRPVRPAILWNDQRATAECAELLRRYPEIGRHANGAPDPGITAPKLMWLAEHAPEAVAAARLILLPKDYVRLALTGEVASEPTDAGGTMLLDCATGEWDAGLCAAAGWPMDRLPPLTESWAEAGRVRPELARRWGLGAAVPVAAGAGDNMAATLGVGAARPGEAVLTLGTSGVACIVDGAFHPAPERAILTSAHAAPGTFLSMGVVMSATAALEWAARLTGMAAAGLAGEAEVLATEDRIAQAPVFLPCLNGIRTPLNRPDAAGCIDGLRPGTDRAMLAYAAMEGVAFQFAECVAAQAAAGVAARDIAAVGGGTRSGLWVRLLATVLDQYLALPPNAHVAAPAGAARLGAVAAGAGAATEILGKRERAVAGADPDAGLLKHLKGRVERFRRLLPQPAGG